MAYCVLVCGDRNWKDEFPIWVRLRSLVGDVVVIHGDCRGVDKLAAVAAKDLGFRVIPFPAEWEVYGKAAGPIRNQQMLDEGNPDIVIAFHKDYLKSKGTKDMVDRAYKAGVPIEVWEEDRDIVRLKYEWNKS